MITSKPRLYYQTKLKVGEVLDDPALLNSLPYLDLDDTLSLQDFFLSTIKLKVTWDQIKNADYMKYGNAYYWIKPQMINENCAQVYCFCDYITSLGGPKNLNFANQGIIKRAHPQGSGGGYRKNTCEEPVGCSKILVAHPVTFNMLGGDTGEVNIVASTIRLDDDGVDLLPNHQRDALAFSSQVTIGQGNQEYVVVIPRCPEPATGTTIRAFGNEYTTSGYGLYDASNATVKRNIEYVRSLGLTNCILFSYTIPLGLAAPVIKNQYGHIEYLGQPYSQVQSDEGWRGANSSDLMQGMTNPNAYFYDKTKIMYNEHSIRSRLSGDLKSFKTIDILNGSTDNEHTCSFEYNIDPQFGGTCYCAPKFFQNTENNALKISNSVKGLPWKEVALCYTGASGSLWERNNYALREGERNIFGGRSGGGLNELAGDLMNMGLKGVGANAAGFLTTFNDTVVRPALGMGKIDRAPGINMDPIEYDKLKSKAPYLQSQVVAPELSTAPALGLQAFVKNSFDIFHVCPSDDDLQNIDNFFDQFGYAMPNVRFSDTYMFNKKNFNYIEAQGVKILGGKNGNTMPAVAGQRIIDEAEKQLEGGIRIWHKLPNNNNSRS